MLFSTIIGCVLTGIIRSTLGASGGAGIIFYIIASIENAVMCAGMSSPLIANGFDRLYRNAEFNSEEGVLWYLIKRRRRGEDNIVFMIINTVIYCALALMGLFDPLLSFLPPAYVLLRTVYLKIRLR